jgi:hypothetical protein
MNRITIHARDSKLKWDLYDRRHEDYMTRFRALDNALLDHTTILDTVVSKVSSLTSRLDHLDNAHTRQTDAIDEAFAAADATLQSGLQGLVSEVSDCLDRNIHNRGTTLGTNSPQTGEGLAARVTNNVETPLPSGGGSPSFSPSNPDVNGLTPPRGRHPRFANVVNRWSNEEQYDSDAAYAASSHTPHSQASRSSTQISPDHIPFEPRGYTTPNSWDSGFVSPRHCESMLRGLEPHILAWHAGQLVGGDPIHGSPFMEAPDVEELDHIDPAVAARIAEDHFQLIREWENPQWHQADAKVFGSQPRFSAPSSSGPNITDILKQIATWDKLSDLTLSGWLSFYNCLRRAALRWKIALMPFEAISLTYEYQGHNLCICGLGVNRWRRMGDALFLVLEYLLPEGNAIIKTTMMSLANGSTLANGYTLLWILLKEFIPMFDRTQPAYFPSWPQSDDIFEFGYLVLMYCDLSRHHGRPFTEAMKSRMFLNNVRGRYVALAQPYAPLVGTYCPGRDGITRCADTFPQHLTVLELARSFYDSIQGLSAHPGQHQSAAHAFHIGGYTPPLDTTPSLTSSHHSGASPSTITSPGSMISSGRPTHLQGYSANLTRTHPQSDTRRTPPNPVKRSTLPQRARYEGACEACGKYGHPAARCDMLAMALYLQRYSRDRNNAATIKEAEERWLTRNKPFLPQDSRTPRTILANYCSELQFAEDKVDAELDWAYMVDDDFVEDNTSE